MISMIRENCIHNKIKGFVNDQFEVIILNDYTDYNISEKQNFVENNELISENFHITLETFTFTNCCCNSR